MTLNREHLRQGTLMTVDAVMMVVSFLLALKLASRHS
jgi:hypothetical protein